MFLFRYVLTFRVRPCVQDMAGSGPSTTLYLVLLSVRWSWMC